MNLPIPTNSTGGLLLAGVFGLLFGALLQKGRVTDYNVIVNFFRLRDLTVLKIMLTAIVVGGIGVASMLGLGLIEGYHIKETRLLGLVLGSALFGIGMVIYGYCPGTGVAAVATGSLHALVGFGGMIAGGVAYALSYGWIKSAILGVGDYGKVRLGEVTGMPDALLLGLLAIIAIALFALLERKRRGPRADGA